MNEVIIYEHRNAPPQVYDISTSEKEEGAYRLLFEDMDEMDVFNFERIIEDKQKRIEELENPEMTFEDGSVGVDIGHNYIRKVGPEEREEEIQELKRDLREAKRNQSLYEDAKEGDPDAAKEIVESMKGRPYSDYRTVKVRNDNDTT